MFSERNRYILKLLLHMANQPDQPGEYKTVSSWSDEANIPEPYLGKIVGFLSDEGYLESKKGPSGGIRLRNRPDEILMTTLLNDIDVFDHTRKKDDCCVPMEFDECVIAQWMDEFKSEVLQKRTLRDVAEQLNCVD